jgi:hypothetical protein
MYSTGDSMAKSLAGLIDNDNLTEDAEMKKKKFLSAIPSSFNTEWGMEVWKRVGKHHERGPKPG